MTREFFLHQIERLKIRFGAKSFDPEFIRILGLEIASLSDEFFRRTVDTWIGTRKNNNPPLLTDFREARLAHEKTKFTQEVSGAARTFEYKPFKDIMRKHYNVDSLSEAIELERLRLRLGDSSGEGTK